MEGVADLLRGRVPAVAVVAAHMEAAAPSVALGFDRCVSAGANEVIVVPYFLAPGQHSATDIPRLAAEAVARHPGVSCVLTQPLGVSTALCDVVLERVIEALARTQTPEWPGWSGARPMADY